MKIYISRRKKSIWRKKYSKFLDPDWVKIILLISSLSTVESSDDEFIKYLSNLIFQSNDQNFAVEDCWGNVQIEQSHHEYSGR